MNRPILDVHKIPEDERILMIGSAAMQTITGILLEKDQPEKIARYISKVTAGFPGVRHIDTVDGPTPNTVLVKFGPTAAQSANVNYLNRAPILDQLEGHWEKIVSLLLWKLAKPGETVFITGKDIEAFELEDRKVLFANGMGDHFSFKLVTKEEAHRLAAHEESQAGRA